MGGALNSDMHRATIRGGEVQRPDPPAAQIRGSRSRVADVLHTRAIVRIEPAKRAGTI
jgi:hypothetical protein